MREAIKLTWEPVGEKGRYRKMYMGRRWNSPTYDADSRRNRSTAWQLFIEFRGRTIAQQAADEQLALSADPIRKETAERVQTIGQIAELIGDDAGARFSRQLIRMLTELDAEGVEEIRQRLNLDADTEFERVGLKLIEAKRQITPQHDDLQARTIADNFLGLQRQRAKQGNISAGRFGVIRNGVTNFLAWYGDSKPLPELSETTVQQYYLHLSERITNGENPNTLWDHWQVFRQFVDSAAEDHPEIARPGNLRSKKFSISKRRTEPKTFSKSEVQTLLDNATERTKLYLLLMLNCGMYQEDVADLDASEIDWTNGRIIRARNKKDRIQSKKGKQPVKLNWLLWNETFQLLQRLGNRNGTVLLTEQGKPLVESAIRGNGNEFRNDAIRSAYCRLINTLKNRDKLPKEWNKTMKQLRKTGADTLEKSKEHSIYYEMYLDHSAVAKRHYLKSGEAVPAFDAAITWFGDQLGIK